MAVKSRAHMLKYVVLAVGVADGIGVYIAHNRLNQPVVDNAGDEAFVLATAASPNSQASVPDEIGNFSVADPRVQAPRTPSPQELAQIDLPLPPMSSDARQPRVANRMASPHQFSQIGLPRPGTGRADAPGAGKVARAASNRQGAWSDLPPMARDPLASKGTAVATRPALSGAGIRSKPSGHRLAERSNAFQARLDLPETHLVSPARSRSPMASAAYSHPRVVASAHRAASVSRKYPGQAEHADFSEAFADGVESAQIPDVSFGQQGELLLNQPMASETAPVVVGNAGVPPSPQADDASAASPEAGSAQPALKLPLPTPDTDSSPSKL